MSRRLTRRLLFTLLPLVPLTSAARAQSWETCGSIHTLNGEAPGDQFGFIVRGALDTDMDGVTDFVVGAIGNDAGGPQAGRGYLYSGASGALRFSFTGSTPGGALGYVANGAGDVNADGHGDVIFGAPDLTNATPGAAFVYSGLDGSLLYTYQGEANGDRFGQNANRLGDIDADGFDDFAVGAEQHSSAGPARGRVYIYSGVDGSLIAALDGDLDGDQLGSGIAPAADRDGDGHDDFLLGAHQGNGGGPGKAWLYSGATLQRVCSFAAPPLGVNFGLYMMGTVGDMNLDLSPDFFISDFNNNSGAGHVRVYSGADCSILYELSGDAPGDTFGTGSGAAGGDVDGDGVDDLVFGALGAGTSNRGQLAVFSGADGSRIGTINGDIPNDSFGFSASGGGDLDGDGFADYLVGTPNNGNGRGIVHALSSRPLPPRQTCPPSPNSVGAGALLTHRRAVSVGGNDMRLNIQGGPSNQSGLYFYGPSQVAFPLGDGVRCAGPSVARIGPLETLSQAGTSLRTLDFTSGPFASGPHAITAGSTWHFQFWYRDPGGASGSNLSNGLRLTFCP